MDYLMPVIAILAILAVLVTGWILTLFSLPGNWVMVVGVAIYAYLVPNTWRLDVGPLAVGGLLALAIIGEIVESFAVAWGATRAGGSRRSALLALCGSIGGGLAGGVIGLPIPLIGSVIAAVLGAAFGAAAGAMIGESWKGRSTDQGFEVGKAAFWGRLLGTLGKIVVASIMVAITLVTIITR